jgi:hypothetical protein
MIVLGKNIRLITKQSLTIIMIKKKKKKKKNNIILNLEEVIFHVEL